MSNGQEAARGCEDFIVVTPSDTVGRRTPRVRPGGCAPPDRYAPWPAVRWQPAHRAWSVRSPAPQRPPAPSAAGVDHRHVPCPRKALRPAPTRQAISGYADQADCTRQRPNERHRLASCALRTRRRVPLRPLMAEVASLCHSSRTLPAQTLVQTGAVAQERVKENQGEAQRAPERSTSAYRYRASRSAA